MRYAAIILKAYGFNRHQGVLDQETRKVICETDVHGVADEIASALNDREQQRIDRTRIKSVKLLKNKKGKQK